LEAIFAKKALVDMQEKYSIFTQANEVFGKRDTVHKFSMKTQIVEMPIISRTSYA
jgi:hypothetical protein